MRKQADSFPEFIFLFRMMKGTIVPVIPAFFLSRHGRPLGLEKKQSWVASAFSFFFMFFRPCRAIQPVSCRDFSFQEVVHTLWKQRECQLQSVMQSPSRVFALSRKRGWAEWLAECFTWPGEVPGRLNSLCYGKWRKRCCQKKVIPVPGPPALFELRKAGQGSIPSAWPFLPG